MADKVMKMPVNYEAEQAMLGSIMMDTNVANDFTTLLREDDFALQQHKQIFLAIYNLIQNNEPVDALTVADKLATSGKIAEAGGMEYIGKLATGIPSTANADKYFEIVKRDSLLRGIIEAGNKISKNAYTAEDANKALDFAEQTIFRISEEKEASKLEPIVEASSEALNKINTMQRGDYVDEGIKTGFKLLDRKIESMKPGALCILAARPSVGKTAFALTVAINAAIRNNKKVAIFSFEMPTVQLVQRMLTTVSQISFKRQKQPGMLNFNETQRLFNAHEALSNSKIYVDDNSGNTPGDIISKCRRMKNTVGLDLVIIDYLQLITLDTKSKAENRQQEVSTMSRQMKLYAKELGVPFLVLSQLSRGTEQRGEEPQLSDLRESGAIEQDADMVMFLHRPKKVENPKSEESKFAASYDDDGDHKFVKMLVAKNRNGETGNVYFDWCGDMQTFKPIDIREMSTAEEKQPAAKLNTEITSVEQMRSDDDAFDDMKMVDDDGQKGTVEIVMDDTATPATIKEEPLDFSDSDGMTFTNNESGDQSINYGDLPF